MENNSEEKSCKEIFDYVIVGAGTEGCVIANRLSEDPSVTVCVLESGRDDSKIPVSKLKLPQKSPAPVPQPGDFSWGEYIRGGFFTIGELVNRGFINFWFMARYSPHPTSHKIQYARASTWGGCSSHNYCVATRQSPFNWDDWVNAGLPEWNAAAMIPFYKKAQNRSQIASPQFGGQPYYSNTIPIGIMGNFNPATDGFNGQVPEMWFDSSFTNPPFTIALKSAVVDNPINVANSVFNYANPPYPALVDIGTQDRTIFAQGGLGTSDLTLLDQGGTLTLPGTSTQVTAVQFNEMLYGDGGYVYPPELAPFGLVGLALVERMTSTNTYLYAALNRQNLTVKSKVLATKILVTQSPTCRKKLRAVGVQYLKGWNIYQAGRNPSPLVGGYGGTKGDAQFNGVKARNKGFFEVYARKEVILSAGTFNSPQLMMLSGLGPKKHLNRLGIPVLRNIPGVGQNLQDNIELFVTHETINSPANITFSLSAKSVASKPYPDFELLPNANGGGVPLESTDPTMQYGWLRVRSVGGNTQLFDGNKPSNFLLDWSVVQNTTTGPSTFVPKYHDPSKIVVTIVEKEIAATTRGSVKLQSKDPTVPPVITYNTNGDVQDVQDVFNVMYNNYLPILLALEPFGFYAAIVDPQPSDFLLAGNTEFTSMSQIDPVRLLNYISNTVGGHHASSTLKMGPKSDRMAVCDSRGRVRGVKSLRVADLSASPVNMRWPGFNLYPVGERIAHFIKQDNK